MVQSTNYCSRLDANRLYLGVGDNREFSDLGSSIGTIICNPPSVRNTDHHCISLGLVHMTGIVSLDTILFLNHPLMHFTHIMFLRPMLKV